MNELLFECYSIPKVAYGVDCLFSFDYNKVSGEIMTSYDFQDVNDVTRKSSDFKNVILAQFMTQL